jgi:deoxycytidine triphosphate deaminase
MLTAPEIHDLLVSGVLRFDPLIDPDRIRQGVFVLRLGTELAEFPSPELVDKGHSQLDDFEALSPQPFSLELGNSISLQPGNGILITSLEYVMFPPDLAALMVLRPSLSRLGLLSQLSTIYPGFQGKLVSVLHNFGKVPVRLYPGMSLFNLNFFRTNMPPPLNHVVSQGATHSFNSRLPMLDIEMITEHMAKRSMSLLTHTHPTSELRELLEAVASAPREAKGRSLERFVSALIESIKGLRILKKNARLRAEEIDILVHNDIDTGFWRYAGTPILVECKNWSTKVGASEITVVAGKLRSISPKATTAILVAPLGVTGHISTDATLQLREQRQDGLDILTLTMPDLEEVVAGLPAARAIERAYGRLYLI